MDSIKSLLPTSLEVHSYTPDHFIIKCTIADLLLSSNQKKVINWKYNRPPDTIRCNEIAESIYAKKQELDWLIYMVYDKGALHIIDGIHRFHSLQIIKRENSKPEDLITPSIFGNNNSAGWLYEKQLLISIRLNMSEGQKVDLFQSLNKSNPVPELYMFDTDQEKRHIIETNANEWVTKFKSHFTASQNPQIPHMNRDRFIDVLSYVYDKYELNNSTRYLLTEKLYELNTKLKKEPPKKTREAALEKCNKTGCYIFLIKREQLQECL